MFWLLNHTDLKKKHFVCLGPIEFNILFYEPKVAALRSVVLNGLPVLLGDNPINVSNTCVTN